MPKKLKLSLLISTATLFCSSSWAWGYFAHRTIAIIAEKNLSPEAHKQCQTLLAGQSFADASSWADDVRDKKEWKHSKYYHYKNIDDDDYFDNLSGLSNTDRKKGDVLRAILRAEDTLRDSATTSAQKKLALQFLIHFIGDIHQPLHLGYRADTGGNEVAVKWFGKTVDLHSLWDNGLIKTILQKEIAKEKPTEDDFIQILKTPSPDQLNIWNKTSTMDWFQESLTARTEAYKGYSGDNDIYYKKMSPMIKQRILQAGYRLAHLLNAIAKAPSVNTSDAIQLRHHILPLVNFDDTYQIQLETK